MVQIGVGVDTFLPTESQTGSADDTADTKIAYRAHGTRIAAPPAVRGIRIDIDAHTVAQRQAS